MSGLLKMYLPDYSCDWIMCINWIYFFCHYLIQAAEEKTINEVKPIGNPDKESGSEELRNMNCGQENYDGMTIIFLHLNVR